MTRVVKVLVKTEIKAENQPPQITQISAFGRLSFDDGVITLAYTEPEEANVLLKFNEKFPDTVIIKRQTDRSALTIICKPDFTHNATYKTQYGDLTLTIKTKTVENSVSGEGGTIKAVYTVDSAQTTTAVFAILPI